MKKIYTTTEYKLRHKRRLLNINKKLRKKSRRKENPSNETSPKKLIKPKKRTTYKNKAENKIRSRNVINKQVIAPSDLRLIQNTEACLLFFRELRSEEFLNRLGNANFVLFTLKNVEKIDYGTISILTAISDDLKYRGIGLQVDFPDEIGCKKFIIESGILNHMVDDKGKKFPKAEKSDLIFFEKGCGVLSDEDNRKISFMVKNVVNHLTGEEKYCLPVKTIILEICGNSIEWSGTDNQQWLLGVKYEEDRVFFTLTDVGKGILQTLNRKFRKQLEDIFTLKSSDEILKGAFNKKYGSKTQEENRNKGLPSVKANFTEGTILELKVLTNNVILHFDNESLSKTLKSGSPRFKGTFYQWVMTKDCINKISI